VAAFVCHDVDPMLIYRSAYIGRGDNTKEGTYACFSQSLVTQISCTMEYTLTVLFSF
jgi:hypothetical protein